MINFALELQKLRKKVMSKKVIWKIAFAVALIVIVAVGIAGYKLYQFIYMPNLVSSEGQCTVFIEKESDFQDLIYQFEELNCLEDISSFEWVARQMNYNSRQMKPGRYQLKNGMNNRDIVRKLRSGNQDAINVVLPPSRDLETIAQRASRALMPDSSQFASYFFSETLMADFGLDSVALKSKIIPNTYQMWWTSTPKDLVDRLLKENDRFWNQNRRNERAKEQGLSKEEVIILASIVEMETNYNPEKPMIAGVYLNRLNNSWPLQADPTVVFALGDPSIRRVLTKDLQIDSPYNTYKNQGLPPGPICIPSISSIEAVLSPETHEYFYFCAKPDNSGTHVFSRSLNAHLNNASRFQNWLNNQRIMR